MPPDEGAENDLANKLNFEANKIEAISKACLDRDIAALVKHADSIDGLLNDTLRAKAWPLLLGCTGSDSERNTAWEKLPAHAEEEQVQKDVDRAFVYYPTESQQSISHRRSALYDLIVRVLRTYRFLNYFQGYHDIAQVFLLVLGEQVGFEAVSRVSLFRIRDYMLPSLAPSERHLLLIPSILIQTDPELASHIGNVPPYFALSAVLTLFAHDIEAYTEIARLYDFVLAHEPVMTIYLFVALIVSRRDELLEFEANDHDMILFTLQKLPQPLNLQGLIDRCLSIFDKHPPETLRAWSRISNASVLKTSRKALREQSTDQAQEYFRVQSQQLEWDQWKERQWKQASARVYARRKPIAYTGLAIFVGVVSYYLRRNGHDRTLWTSLLQLRGLLLN